MASTLLQGARTATDTSEARLASEVRELVTQLRRDFAERDELYADIDDVLYQTIPVKIPDAYREITQVRRSSAAIEMTNAITSAWTINAPEVQFLPVAFGDAAQENATLREHFFDASWRRQVQEAGGNVFRRYVHSVVCKGEGVLKTFERSKSAWAAYTRSSLAMMDRLTTGDLAKLDLDAKDRIYSASAEEAKRAAPYPIQTIDVPPEQFYYWKHDGLGITLACEVKQVPYLEALTRFGAGLNRNGHVVAEALGESRPPGPFGGSEALPSHEWSNVMKGVSTLTLIELWRAENVVYVLLGPGQVASGTGMARGTVVKTMRHGYADPLTKALRGPYFHTLGSVTSSRVPGRAGLGVLFGYLTLFPMLDTLRTMQHTAAILTGFPAFKRKAPANTGLPAPYGDDQLSEAREAVPIQPGMIYPYDVEPVEQPTASPALMQAMADIREEMQGILPPVLQGMTAETDSGYEYNQATYLARVKWSAPIQNIEQTLSDRTGFESWLIERKIGETVYAWGDPPKSRTPRRKGGDQGWLGVGPEDLNGVHNYRVRLNPETPANEVIKVRTHVEMVQAQFEDIDDARTDLGKNPDEVEAAILYRQMKQDPDVIALFKKRLLQKLGQGDLVAQANAQKMLTQMDQGPQAGGFANGAPDVFMPGQNGQPLTPSAPGPDVTGAGGGLPASLPGAPAGTPATNIPLAGQGPTAPQGQ